MHLVDGHLGSMTLDELYKTATLARRDLDVGDLAKPLEERAQLIFGNVARQTSDEDSGIVGVSELVHWLRLLLLLTTVEWHGRLTHWWISHRASTRHPHVHASHWASLVLRSRGRDAHRTIATVDTLHLIKSTLLVAFVGEAHKPVATGHARERIGHDLG